jgi:hypothetical protein
MLDEVAPALYYIRSAFESDASTVLSEFEAVKHNEKISDITLRDSFEEFIHTEMN